MQCAQNALFGLFRSRNEILQVWIPLGPFLLSCCISILFPCQHLPSRLQGTDSLFAPVLSHAQEKNSPSSFLLPRNFLNKLPGLLKPITVFQVPLCFPVPSRDLGANPLRYHRHPCVKLSLTVPVKGSNGPFEDIDLLALGGLGVA